MLICDGVTWPDELIGWKLALPIGHALYVLNPMSLAGRPCMHDVPHGSTDPTVPSNTVSGVGRQFCKDYIVFAARTEFCKEGDIAGR